MNISLIALTNSTSPTHIVNNPYLFFICHLYPLFFTNSSFPSRIQSTLPSLLTHISSFSKQLCYFSTLFFPSRSPFSSIYLLSLHPFPIQQTIHFLPSRFPFKNHLKTQQTPPHASLSTLYKSSFHPFSLSSIFFTSLQFSSPIPHFHIIVLPTIPHTLSFLLLVMKSL